MRFMLVSILGIFLAGVGSAQKPISFSSAGPDWANPPLLSAGQFVTLAFWGISDEVPDRARAGVVPLPTALGGVSIRFRGETLKEHPAAILEVAKTYPCPKSFWPEISGDACAPGVLVTLQVPDEISTSFNLPFPQYDFGTIKLAINGVERAQFWYRTAVAAHRFLLTSDPGSDSWGGPVITHRNGEQVTMLNPALPGEDLIVYAVGLGRTAPPVATGEPSPSGASVGMRYSLSLDYAFNGGENPLTEKFSPVEFMLTPGAVGLYEATVTVPSPPAAAEPCRFFGPASAGVGVRSNLTVTSDAFRRRWPVPAPGFPLRRPFTAAPIM